jgi:aspartate racemase
MYLNKDRVIGIVGGMGPEAGISLYNKILSYTKATTDQQHLSVILMSFPKYIVDRTLFLEGKTGINPGVTIAKIIRKLEKSGAKVIGIACNTSHAPEIYSIIVDDLHAAGSRVKLLNMPDETCKYIKKNYSNVRRIGLMTTNGTYKSGIYRKILENYGYDVVIPDSLFQEEVIHNMIYNELFGIKSNPNKITNQVKVLMDKSLLFFKERESDAIILGCTELSLVFKKRIVNNMQIVDSSDAFACALVREATL